MTLEFKALKSLWLGGRNTFFTSALAPNHNDFLIKQLILDTAWLMYWCVFVLLSVLWVVLYVVVVVVGLWSDLIKADLLSRLRNHWSWVSYCCFLRPVKILDSADSHGVIMTRVLWLKLLEQMIAAYRWTLGASLGLTGLIWGRQCVVTGLLLNSGSDCVMMRTL